MLLSISFYSDIPIYTQIYEQIIIGMVSGQLTFGESLPSVRALSAEIGVNLHTVNKAYAMLRDEGYIKMDRRIGAVVTNPPAEDLTNKLADRLRPMAAEAICKGVSEQAFLDICRSIFEEFKEENGI
ncbi:GntR family transcriptional regulator [Marasmitruncus massiliensis]|uniref:GntR family transcriptional regulator n=1 Tax=Marasmitruncus massiliensis TaxID=1944642 RepID=UPI000C7C81ED|nr:GntR family transcriptional regulator [Marasmitruncus massiliensis]MBE6905552.1 GntR family transcriptional regulator [Oscillospiraceae bacterium]